MSSKGSGMSSKRKAPDAADPAHKAAEDPTPNKKKASKSQGRMHRGALCEASANETGKPSGFPLNVGTRP